MQQHFKILVTGSVQGVGFRPFVYRLANKMQLNGYIQNSLTGVLIEIESTQQELDNFLLHLQDDKPAIAAIYNIEYSVQDIIGYTKFEIRNSNHTGKKTATVLPDLTVCKDCLRELFNADDRRYRYPFINCTNCGPRFSIIENIPYDRCNTSMKNFEMCPQCQQEYDNVNDRRFHAQPNACPVCGPQVELWNVKGEVLAKHNEALMAAAKQIREGKIVALKGLGGFQLLVDARNENAVDELRKRKHRNEKPFALMYPSLEIVKEDCNVSALEERLLLSSAAPIVLLERKNKSEVADNIAPNNPYLGVMLPYTPLHHLLMHELNFPIVATSGNLSDEPICIDEHEALNRLQNIADIFLIHNRQIVRQVDDSIVRIVAGREQVLRRARGFAPLPIYLKNNLPNTIAVGAHLKNSIAVSNGNQIFVSQHIGDLETEQAYSAFKNIINDFKNLYEIKPEQVICDLHPEYLSSKYAKQISKNVTVVQHHYAHVLSCMADNEIEDDVLGVSWDGTGLGTDGTIWGSEFLLTGENGFERVAHFRNFPLPGGEASIKQPRRTAIGVLYEIFGDVIFDNGNLESIQEIAGGDKIKMRSEDASHSMYASRLFAPVQQFSSSELELLKQVLKKKINSPVTCSVGRLFDAVASIICLRQQLNFEGQAAMELEFMIDKNVYDVYSFVIKNKNPYIIDWQQMIEEIIDDVKNNIGKGIISAKFHNTLVEMIVNVAYKMNREKIVLTGGCFQNKYLTERSVQRLSEEGFKPYWHQRIPCNDGGISAGQIMAAKFLNNNMIEKEGAGMKLEYSMP